MLSKVLVPLDGSELAEAVLPYVEEVCRRCEPVEVVLLQVVTLPSGRSGGVFRVVGEDPTELVPESAADLEAARFPIYRDQAIASARAEVETALARATKRLCDGGLKVRIEVGFGRPAEEIIDFAEREGMELIVMATHGRSGLSRWIIGSVADKVLHGTHLPILLVRPEGLTGIPFPPQTEIEI